MMQVFGANLFLPLVLFLAGQGAVAEELRKSAAPPLVTIDQARRLGHEGSAGGLPVRVRGVVTYRRHGYHCFLQDEKGAIFVHRSRDAVRIEPGDMVEVEGVARPGYYTLSTYLEERKIRILGRGRLPTPRRPAFEELASSANHCRWAEVNGFVRSVSIDDGRTEVRLSLGDGKLIALSYNAPEIGRLGLVGARVRIRGALGGQFNPQGQLAWPVLYFSDISYIQAGKPVPANPYEIAVFPVRQLRQYRPEIAPGERVKVRGTVTYHQPGKRIFLKDSSGSLLVNTRETAHAAPGDIVEVLGFPAMRNSRPYLEDSIFRVTGRERPPEPARLKPETASLGAEDAGLVVVDATLIHKVQYANDRTLVLYNDSLVLGAQLDPAASRLWGELPLGARVRAGGILLVEDVMESDLTPVRPLFRLLVRSPRDLAVTAYPSWWTAERLLGVIALLLISVSAAAGWVWALRRKVRKQTGIIHCKVRKDAVNEERQRIARDFHDTLQQDLVGVMMQLETSLAQLERSPSFAANSLDIAAKMVRRCIAGVRAVVWDLHSRPLAEEGLPAALAVVTRPRSKGATPSVAFEVFGKTHKLSTSLETQLLRITEEAVSNAVQHAGAKSVRVELHYTDESIRLRVVDDGCGFNPSSRLEGHTGHLGLLSIRWRAERAGGRLRLKSRPGEGTEIEVEAPLTEPAWPSRRDSAAAEAATP